MKRKKFLGYCEECKKTLCEEHAYFYVDGNNISITNSSPYLCIKCYQIKYGEIIKKDIDIFKENLINTLEKIRREQHIEKIKINNLIKYIENLE